MSDQIVAALNRIAGSEQIVTALIAFAGSMLGSGMVTLLTQRMLERHIATSRAIGEQFAKERFETIQRLGSILHRIEREAKRQQQQLRLTLPASESASFGDAQSRLMEAIENYPSERPESSIASSVTLPKLALEEYGMLGTTTLPSGAWRAPPSSQPQELRGQDGLWGELRDRAQFVWSRITCSASKKASRPQELSPEMLDGFLYRWRPLNEAEAELEREIREALDGAYLFLSPKVLKRFEVLLPRSLRGDTKAAAKMRVLLREAMEGAHRG